MNVCSPQPSTETEAEAGILDGYICYILLSREHSKAVLHVRGPPCAVQVQALIEHIDWLGGGESSVLSMLNITCLLLYLHVPVMSDGTVVQEVVQLRNKGCEGGATEDPKLTFHFCHFNTVLQILRQISFLTV